MQHGILCNLWFRSGKNWVDSTCEDSKGSPLSNFRTRCCHRPEPCKCQQPRKTKEKMLAAATRRRRPIFISRLLCSILELSRTQIFWTSNPSDRNISLFGVQIILLQVYLVISGRFDIWEVLLQIQMGLEFEIFEFDPTIHQIKHIPVGPITK